MCDARKTIQDGLLEARNRIGIIEDILINSGLSPEDKATAKNDLFELYRKIDSLRELADKLNGC